MADNINISTSVRKEEVDVFKLDFSNGSNGNPSNDNEIIININCADHDKESEYYEGGKYGLVQLSGSNIDGSGASDFHSTFQRSVEDVVTNEIIFSTKRNREGALVVTIPSEYLNHDEQFKPLSLTVTTATALNAGVIKIGTEINTATKSAIGGNHQSTTTSTLNVNDVLFDFPNTGDKAIQMPLVMDSNDHAYTLLNRKFLKTSIYDYEITAEYDTQSTETTSNYTITGTLPTEDCILTVRFNDVKTNLLTLEDKQIYYSGSDNVLLTGEHFGAIEGLDFLITMEYRNNSDDFRFINCHRINFVEGGEYVSVENGVVDLTKHHLVIGHKEVIRSQNNSTGWLWEVLCLLNDRTLKVANVNDFFVTELDHKCKFIFDSHVRTTSRKYIKLVDIRNVSISGSMNIIITNKDSEDVQHHYIAVVMDPGPDDFTITTMTSLEWNVLPYRISNDAKEIAMYLEVPIGFYGTIEISPIGFKKSNNIYPVEIGEAIEGAVKYNYETTTEDYINLELGEYLQGTSILSLVDDGVLTPFSYPWEDHAGGYNYIRAPYGKVYTSLIGKFGQLQIGLMIHDVVINDAILHLIEHKLASLESSYGNSNLTGNEIDG